MIFVLVLGSYLYSTRCSWIINQNILQRQKLHLRSKAKTENTIELTLDEKLHFCKNVQTTLTCSLVTPQGPTQSVWVADCYFIVNVLDLPFASAMAIYR